MTQKRKRGWTADMKGCNEQGEQVKCLISDEGWRWMSWFDPLPAVVRQRLSKSRHNICAACMAIEARKIARKPTAKIFIEVIEAIERKLDQRRPLA